MASNALLTSTQAGAVLGVSSATVRRWTKLGRLRAMQTLPGPNGAFLYERAEVLRYAADRAEVLRGAAELRRRQAEVAADRAEVVLRGAAELTRHQAEAAATA